MNGQCSYQRILSFQNSVPFQSFQPRRSSMITRILAILAFVFIAAPNAFAQGNCQQHYGGGQSGWFGCGNNRNNTQTVVTQQQVIIPQGVAPQMVYAVPSGAVAGSSSQCAGVAERLGRVIGANRGNDARNTENGGFAGFLLGNLFCPAPQPVMAQTMQGVPANVQQGVVTSAPQGDSGFMCAVEGIKEAFLVKDKSTCSQIAGRKALEKVGNDQHQDTPSGTQPQGQAVFTPISQGRPAEIDKTCYLGAPHGTYRFNAVEGVKIGKSECLAIKGGQKPLPPVSNLSIIP